jgi:DNA replication protein DnaC
MHAKILELMKSLRLRGMAGVLERELAHAEREGLAPAEVINRLVLEEFHHRQERSLLYRIDQAAMPWPWTLESFPFLQQPGVSKSQIMSLASLAFVERAENIVFIGDPGTGKTGLAIGLLREALVSGFRGRFYKAQDLLDELYASHADRTTPKLLKRLVRYDLLVIDELGYLTVNPQQVNSFFKLMDERYSRKPTIITSNLDYPEWYGFLQNKQLVDALLDRINHHCITIRISGPSLRAPTHSQSQDTDHDASKKQPTKIKSKTKPPAQ